MPLKEGRSKDAVSANIKELVDSGYDPKQAAAIAYKKAGKARKDRGYRTAKREEL